MSRLAIAVLALLVAQVEFIRPTEQPSETWISHAFKKRYTSNIAGTDLARSPKWDKDAENPPISARKALSLATKMKGSLVKDEQHYKWILVSLELQPTRFERWVWVARYRAIFSFGYIVPPEDLTLVVTMDGTVIEPKVSDAKAGCFPEPEITPNSK